MDFDKNGQGKIRILGKISTVDGTRRGRDGEVMSPTYDSGAPILSFSYFDNDSIRDETLIKYTFQ